MKPYDPMPDFDPQSDFNDAPEPKGSRLATIGGVILWTMAAVLCVLVLTRVVVIR